MDKANQCGEVKNEYEEIKALKQAFSSACEQARATKDLEDLEKAKDLKKQLEEKREALLERIDPDQIKLRSELAQSFQLEYVGKFSEEGIARAKQKGEWLYIKKKGKEICPGERFHETRPFNEGMARVRKGGEWFFINREGEEIAGPFIRAQDFNEGVALATKPNQFLFIDSTGKVIAGGFSAAGGFSEGVALVEKDGKYFCIDKEGNKTTGNFDDARGLSEGIALVRRLDAWFFINGKGEKISDSFFDEDVRMLSFEEGMALAQPARGGTVFFINKEGKKISSPDRYGFEGAGEFKGDRARIEEQGLCFFIDKEGNKKTGEFIDAQDFHEGVAWVRKTGRWLWSLIDVNGKEIVPEKFNEAHTFEEGVAHVKEGNEWFCIDKRGRRVCLKL